MPAFNGRHLQQQIRGLLFFIQLHILMHLLFLRRPQQPPQAAPPPTPPVIQRPRRKAQHVGQAMATTERGEGGLPQHYG